MPLTHLINLTCNLNRNDLYSEKIAFYCNCSSKQTKPEMLKEALKLTIVKVA